jgi:hypothetical protein
MTAQEVYATLSDVAKSQHQAAWQEIENHVRSLIPNNAKVFDAHHSIEHARKLYFAELVKGYPADLCKKNVMRAYNIA